MRLVPSPDTLLDSATNAWDLVVGQGPADLSRQPSAIIDEGPQRTVHRYRARRGARTHRAPVLLVPPLAAPATCFDLRRGCSLAEHLINLGYPTYLVDYGPISFSDRALGLEHWVEDVLPKALRAVSEDAGGAPVQSVGWCLGGIMPAVHHIGSLLENAPEARLEIAPGGHLGVLTGMSARHTTWRYLDEFLVEHDPVRPEHERGAERPTAAEAS